MDSNIIYSLEINGKGNHNSFDFATMSEAIAAYKFLCEKFSENIIKARRSKTFSSDGIVQLNVGELYIGTVPSNIMASFIPEEWFHNVYEEMLRVAKDYYEEHR